jgi:hypothetical protein
MHPSRTVRAALEMAERSATASSIGRELGVSRSTVRYWLASGSECLRRRHEAGCSRCGVEHDLRWLPPEYAYLLGLYLGDGCLSKHPRGVYKLRIVLDVKYPGIIDSAAAAMGSVRNGKAHVQLRPTKCVEVSSYWRAWPCLFPQHGPGRKHEREIALVPWQQDIASRLPEQLLRGLIESDGCRSQNTGRCSLSCPRYSFTNKSDGIRSIFCSACEQMGVHWTASGTDRVYVSRKADVARLDEFIGPKR